MYMYDDKRNTRTTDIYTCTCTYKRQMRWMIHVHVNEGQKYINDTCTCQ